MASLNRLDRRAKTALFGLFILIAGMLALTIRSAIVAVTPDQLITAPASQSQDEIIQLGRHTVLLRHGSAGARIAHWIDTGSHGSRAFEVRDSVFTPGSDTLSGEGERRATMFSQMMAQVDSVHGRILVSTFRGNARLAGLRAQRLRAELIERGVSPSRIAVSPEPITGGAALSIRPELVVVLST
jgi:hypothetical protein